MKLRARSRQGLRSKPLVTHRTFSEPIVLPAQRNSEADAYTWAVNAALEAGQTEAAYEIAAAFNG